MHVQQNLLMLLCQTQNLNNRRTSISADNKRTEYGAWNIYRVQQIYFVKYTQHRIHKFKSQNVTRNMFKTERILEQVLTFW
jgi:hypothetical protein